jgi:multiple sugar transport system permease protein
LPANLDDAAIIDGCSEWGVYRHIILLLAKPALATVALFGARQHGTILSVL